VPVQPGLQFLLGRRRRRDDVLDHELQLLPQPAADDRVVAVEPAAIASRTAISSRTQSSTRPLISTSVGGRCQVFAKPAAR